MPRHDVHCTIWTSRVCNQLQLIHSGQLTLHVLPKKGNALLSAISPTQNRLLRAQPHVTQITPSRAQSQDNSDTTCEVIVGASRCP
jgi:hypothetical protein